MVYEESRKILALSEHPVDFRELKNAPQTRVAVEEWQKEGLALLDAIQLLKDYLSKMPDREDKEFSDNAADWRGGLLQAVQSVFERERSMVQVHLKSHFSSPGSDDGGSLVEKLDYVMKQEEQRQLVVEHLFSSDRNSLLSEIQDLRAQLRMTHFQNQEKLQQLQETLTNVEDHGSKQEHHLRRKVELLEYKLQQEKSLLSELHSMQSEEQKRASEMCDLLNQEKAALKSEIYESKQENERLQKSLGELQREKKQLCSELEQKAKDLTAALEDLQTERLKETELQGLLEELQLQYKKAEDEKTKALEELQAALEQQSVQNRLLDVSLEHEKMVNDNLHKELQIEHSRCEALLSQEQAKLLELQRNLDAEKNSSSKLLNSLNYERVLTEKLIVRVEEKACQYRESQAVVQELKAQLEEERSRTTELAAVIEQTHKAAILSKRQLEDEIQMCREETQKEREVSDELRATLESVQAEKQEVTRSLEAQKEREVKLKADCEQLQSLLKTMKEQDKNKKEEREREQRQQQQRELERQKDQQRDQERLQNLERQHQKDEQSIKELQEIVKILEERERKLLSSNNQQELLYTLNKDRNAKQDITKETEKLCLQQQQQRLEKIRQQLLFVAVYLNEFIKKTVDKTVNDWSVSNDEAVASLLQTLEEVKSDLLSPSTSQIRSAGDTDSVQELERDAWQREKNMLQNALKQAESKLAKASVEIENSKTLKAVLETSSPKLQRLYRRYLRAESFRKALVFQKKYLLLLLGGFQDCEQATLSLIARMGVYPSTADLQLSGFRSHPFIKFRCAVKAIIAISRLKFLVKKWNRDNRKSAQEEIVSHGVRGNTASAARTEILKEQQHPAVHVSSPPTRDAGLSHRTSSARFVSHSPRSSYHSHNRLHPSTTSASEKALASTQDSEQSLMEYIHHLEVIQKRLGGLHGEVPGPPRQRNMKN